MLRFNLGKLLKKRHLNMSPVLTSAWEISGVMEEPILPFITLPPPVMVPEFQERRGLGFRRISRQEKKKHQDNPASYQPSQ